MKLSDINPHIRYARFHQNTELPTNSLYCYDCRLFVIKHGKGAVECNGQVYNFSNNFIIFIPPGTNYRFINHKKGELWSLFIFDFDLVNDFSHLKESLGTATSDNFDPRHIIAYDLPSEFSEIIAHIVPQSQKMLETCINEFLHKDPYYRETASALLKCVLLQILRTVSGTSNLDVIAQVTEYIHTHYAEPNLNNSHIAQAFNYHPYHLSKLMKESTGQTLRTYLLHYRIRIAKDALITTDWDVNTISWKCGFNSPAHFIKQFKQRTGVTPKQYRKNHRNLAF